MAERDFRFGISSSIAGLDIGTFLVKHPHSTYFMRVGDDIEEVGLTSGDIVVVDRSLSPRKKDIVIVSQADDSELRVVRYDSLRSEGQLWGVVVHLIRSLRS